MQLYFIRHGQSENNALWKRTGSTNGHSSELGCILLRWDRQIPRPSAGSGASRAVQLAGLSHSPNF